MQLSIPLRHRPSLLVRLRRVVTVGFSMILGAVIAGLGWYSFTASLRESVPSGRHGQPGTYMRAAGLDLHYMSWGPASGKPILLVHGTLAWSKTWYEIAERLAISQKTVRMLAEGVPTERWILVFDNADNPEELAPYFPQGGGGHILVTSRNQTWEQRGTSLPVDVFPRPDSVEHLSRRAPGLSAEEADRVAEAVGDLPLAVEQAGAWLAETATPIEEYLRQLNEQTTGVLDLNQAPDYPETVAATWNISIARLRERSPASVRLLQLCAFMAPEPISSHLLYSREMLDELKKVENDVTEEIVKNETIKVGENRTEEVGKDETVTIKGKRTHTVEGDEALTTKGNRALVLEKDLTDEVKGKSTTTVTGDVAFTAEANRTAKVSGNETEEVQGNRSAKVGGNSTVEVEGVADKMRVLKKLGTPYTDEQIANAGVDYRAQADVVLGNLAKKEKTGAKQDTEIVALIAYLMRLGRNLEPASAKGASIEGGK